MSHLLKSVDCTQIQWYSCNIMTASRSIQEEHQYRHYRRTHAGEACPFCSIDYGHAQYVKESDQLKVIKNRIPYSIWDGQGVLDHLMITPKKHTDSLKDMDANAALEYVDLISEYESQGYNIYARTPGSSIKSVTHQHTHLIKLDGDNKRFVFVMRKPFYLRISW